MEREKKAFLMKAGLSEKVAGALSAIYSWQECYETLAYLDEVRRFNAN